ncbi:MAG: hypothetical protein EZS28_039411, partial [Streblomastix strix]
LLFLSISNFTDVALAIIPICIIASFVYHNSLFHILVQISSIILLLILLVICVIITIPSDSVQHWYENFQFLYTSHVRGAKLFTLLQLWCVGALAFYKRRTKGKEVEIARTTLEIQRLQENQKSLRQTLLNRGWIKRIVTINLKNLTFLDYINTNDDETSTIASSTTPMPTQNQSDTQTDIQAPQWLIYPHIGTPSQSLIKAGQDTQQYSPLILPSHSPSNVSSSSFKLAHSKQKGGQSIITKSNTEQLVRSSNEQEDISRSQSFDQQGERDETLIYDENEENELAHLQMMGQRQKLLNNQRRLHSLKLKRILFFNFIIVSIPHAILKCLTLLSPIILLIHLYMTPITLVSLPIFLLSIQPLFMSSSSLNTNSQLSAQKNKPKYRFILFSTNLIVFIISALGLAFFTLANDIPSIIKAVINTESYQATVQPTFSEFTLKDLQYQGAYAFSVPLIFSLIFIRHNAEQKAKAAILADHPQQGDDHYQSSYESLVLNGSGDNVNDFIQDQNTYNEEGGSNREVEGDDQIPRNEFGDQKWGRYQAQQEQQQSNIQYGDNRNYINQQSRNGIGLNEPHVDDEQNFPIQVTQSPDRFAGEEETVVMAPKQPLGQYTLCSSFISGLILSHELMRWIAICSMLMIFATYSNNTI